MNWSPFSDWCHEPCPGGQQEDDLDLSEIPGSCVSADGTTQAQGTLTPPGLGAQGLSRDREAKPPHDVINVWKGLGEEERETEHFDLSDSQRWLWAQWTDPHLVCHTDVWNKPCRCRMVLQNTFLPGWNGAADCVLCTALTWQARLESDMAVVCMGEKLASNSHWKVAHPRKTPNTFNQHNQFASNPIMPRVFLRRSWTLSLALL